MNAARDPSSGRRQSNIGTSEIQVDDKFVYDYVRQNHVSSTIAEEDILTQSTGPVAAKRVARDGNGERATYDDIEVGLDLGTMSWTPTAEDIDKQCTIDGDFDPLFEAFGGGEDGRMAPPQLSYRPPRWLFSRVYNVRGVLYRWELDNLGPIRPGVEITLGGKVVGKWIKSDREFVEFEVTGTDPDGRQVFRTRRVHALDVIKRTAPRSGVGLDSGKKPERL